MVQQVSNNIKITVCSEVDIEQSNMEKGLYLHTYTVHIENLKDVSVQLLRRKWFIRSQYGSVKIVDGEGVVGETPIIEPKATYIYSSYCVLECNFGSMEGHYTFHNLGDDSRFTAEIPRFELENKWILN